MSLAETLRAALESGRRASPELIGGDVLDDEALAHGVTPAAVLVAVVDRPEPTVILTLRPERLVKSGALPTVRGIPGLEPRGALWAAIDFDGVVLNVINTHLGLVPREQRLQAAALLGEGWLGHPSCVGPTLLTGDFNATSITRPYQALARRLSDCQRAMGLRPSIKTFPSSFPAIRIDHCFTSPEVVVTGVTAPFSPLARMASDHLPLIVDFEIRP